MKQLPNLKMGRDIYYSPLTTATRSISRFTFGSGSFNVTNEFWSKSFLVNQFFETGMYFSLQKKKH